MIRLAPLVALSAVILVSDQATKRLFEIMFAEADRIVPVTPFFNLVLVHNRGISFGLLSSTHAYAPYILALTTVVIAAGLAVWMWRSKSAIERLGLSAILGGALSNLVDRLEDGAVTDFLDFHAGGYHWPAFNLADVAITCGVVALLFGAIRPKATVTNPHAIDH